MLGAADMKWTCLGSVAAHGQRPVLANRANPRAAARSGGLADALFTRTQQCVLGCLFGRPDESFSAAALVMKLGFAPAAVHRELTRLERSGLVTVQHVSLQKQFQANRESPIFAELASIAQKTLSPTRN